MKFINIIEQIVSNRQKINLSDKLFGDNFSILFEFNLTSLEACKPNIVPHKLITVISGKNKWDIYLIQSNNQVSFVWCNENQKFDGMIINRFDSLKTINEKTLRHYPVKAGWNQFQLSLRQKTIELRINQQKQIILISSELLENIQQSLKLNITRQFEINGSKECQLRKIKVNTKADQNINNKQNCQQVQAGRDKFCQIELPMVTSCFSGQTKCNHKSIKNKIYITPEIYYQVKNCIKDKNENTKKNNVDNNYNMSRKICISNPLQSLKGFTMDFLVKNLILFGLLFLFQTYFANPAIDTNQKLIVCAVVLLIYNLLHIIFVILENIFTWACKYSDQYDDMGSDDL